MSDQLLNGVPVTDVANFIDFVKDNPDKGHTKWNAVTTWSGGFECESKIRNHTIHMNEPEVLGGTDTAPNMVETVLAAYGSCLTVGYTLNASLRGIEIKDLKVELEGDLNLAGFFGLDQEVPAGFTDIRAIVHLEADASPEEVQALHDHVLKTSPVGCILNGVLNISTDVQHNRVGES